MTQDRRFRAGRDLAILGEAARHAKATRGSGDELEVHLRHGLERAFGADLRSLRVHRDADADRMARALEVDAFASGSDLFIRSDADRSGAAGWARLVAHETAHVLQQSALSRHPGAVGPLEPSLEGLLEAQADLAAAAFMRGETVSSSSQPGGLARWSAASTMVQGHGSWEHRLLGEADPDDLNAIALNLPNRKQILEKLLAYLDIWRKDPTSVTEARIRSFYPNMRTFNLVGSKLLVTYGELNTLPDYMANPEILFAQGKDILLPILQAVRQEGYQKINGLLGGWVPWPFDDAVSINTSWSFIDLLLETRKLDKLTADLGPGKTDHYTAVVARNACHFAPYSWYRWRDFFVNAQQLATQAYATTDPTVKSRLTYMAWMNHGYADHFLQDSFAAGHLVNKTLIMQWFVEWAAAVLPWYVSIADWDMVKTMTTARQPGIAATGLYSMPNPGDVRDPQTAEEQTTLQARMDMTGVRADGGTQVQAYQDFLAFLNGIVSQSASGVLHDYFNASSLWVASVANPAPFQIWGDDTMLKGGDGVRIASMTAQMSQQSIVQILATGQTAIDYQAVFDRFPTLVRSASGAMLPLQAWQWSDATKQLAWSLFPAVHYYLLRVLQPRIGNVSIDLPPGAAQARATVPAT